MDSIVHVVVVHPVLFFFVGKFYGRFIDQLGHAGHIYHVDLMA